MDIFLEHVDVQLFERSLTVEGDCIHFNFVFVLFVCAIFLCDSLFPLCQVRFLEVFEFAEV